MFNHKTGKVTMAEEINQAIIIIAPEDILPDSIEVNIDGLTMHNGTDYLLIIGNSKIVVKFLESCPINTEDTYRIRWAYL